MDPLTVVVGLDGSEGSLAALAAAARLAALTNKGVVAVHVVRAYPLPTTAPVSGAGLLAVADDEDIEPGLRDRAQRLVAERTGRIAGAGIRSPR